MQPLKIRWSMPRCSAPALLSALLVVVAPASARAQESGPVELRIGAGEIRLDGQIRSVDGGIFVLAATAFTLPNGKSSPLAPPKDKTILVDHNTRLHVRGAPHRPILVEALRAGVFAIVVGHDQGSGQALPAREVALWDTVREGGFGFKGGAASPGTTGSVAAPGVPPTSDGATNLMHGDFEKLNAAGQPIGWEFARASNIKSVQEAGSHFLRLTNSDAGGVVLIDSFFKLEPAWRGVVVRARLRTRDLRLGTEPYHNARLDYAFVDANGDQVGEWPAPLDLKQNTNWTQRETRALVPAGAVYLKVTPVLQNAAGVFDVDDIVIEEDKSLNVPAAVPIGAGFAPGTFEQIDADGNAIGWKANRLHVQIAEEGANHFARLTNDNGQATVSMEGVFKLDTAWRALKLGARMRTTNLKIGSNSLETAQLRYVFLDPAREKIGPALPRLEVKRDSEWTTLQAVTPIPPGAEYIRLLPSLVNTTGTLDIDDITLEEAKE